MNEGWWPQLRRRLRVAFFLPWLVLLGLGLMAPWVSPELVPVLQLFPAFLTFLAPLFLLFLILFAWGRQWAWLLIATLGLTASLWIGSYDVHGPVKPLPKELPRLCVATYNVATFGYEEQRVEAVAALLRPQQPDVVCFQEFRNHRLDNGQDALDYLGEQLELRHRVFVHMPAHIHGVALLSRFPVVAMDTLFLPHNEINSGILATVETPQGKVGIGSLHLPSYQFSLIWEKQPRYRDRIKAVYLRAKQVVPRQAQRLRQVEEKVAAYPHPLVLVGDFNAAPHTALMRPLNRYLNDSFAQAGTGLGWTFPFWGPLGLRIDYQFHSHELVPGEVTVLRDPASDHYPLLVSYRPAQP